MRDSRQGVELVTITIFCTYARNRKAIYLCLVIELALIALYYGSWSSKWRKWICLYISGADIL